MGTLQCAEPGTRAKAGVAYLAKVPVHVAKCGLALEETAAHGCSVMERDWPLPYRDFGGLMHLAPRTPQRPEMPSAVAITASGFIAPAEAQALASAQSCYLVEALGEMEARRADLYRRRTSRRH
jgi:hypothetical protein